MPASTSSAKPARAAALFFAGVFLLYLSLTPGTVGGMGYAPQDVRACGEMLSWLGRALTLHPGPPPAVWSRHGVVTLLPQAPFVLASRLASGPDSDLVFASAMPILETALLLTLLFVWIRRLTGSETRAFALSLIAGFATMLWPYAYIGLETSQALFLFAAAYLALGRDEPAGWKPTLGFTLLAALTISSKSTAVFLVPAVAYLAYQFLRRANSGRRGKAIVIASLALGFWAFNAWTRTFFWDRYGGNAAFLRHWLVRDPLAFATNLWLFFFSPNKGLFVFAPIAAVALWGVRRLEREDRPLAVFALLTLLGLSGGFSLLKVWSDETWGPRYLHAAIAPLALCIAAAKKNRSVPLRREPGLAAAAALGFGISLLGALFYYGSLKNCADAAQQSTLESYQSDPVWNPIRFDLRLFRAWATGEGAQWAPEHTWYWKVPAGTGPVAEIDLRPMAGPQPILLGGGSPGRRGSRARAACAASLATGIAALIIGFRLGSRISSKA